MTGEVLAPDKRKRGPRTAQRGTVLTCFRIIHPFHSLRGREFEFLGYRRSFGCESIDGRDALQSKARCGELRLRLPVGFVYDAKGEVVLDPDEEVRKSTRLLFVFLVHAAVAILVALVLVVADPFGTGEGGLRDEAAFARRPPY